MTINIANIGTPSNASTNTLSLLTMNQNYLETQKNSVWQKRENRMITESKLNEDCNNLLNKAGKELKVVKYRLSTLVTNGESHIQLFHNTDVKVELISGIIIYARAYVKDKIAPVKILIKKNRKIDLKVLCSHKFTMPNFANASQQFRDSNKINIWPDDIRENTFKNNYLYIGFLSRHDAVIDVRVEFDTKNKRQKQITSSIDRSNYEEEGKSIPLSDSYF